MLHLQAKMSEQKDQMSFLQHLEELRWHLIRSSIAIVGLAVLAFVNKSLLFDGIIFAPKKEDFITFRFLCDLSYKLADLMPQMLSNPELLCLGKNFPELQNINMSGQFTSHIMISVVAGFVVAFPYVFWEIWRFIKPGLSSKERKNTRGIVLYSWFLFLMGMLFGYYIVTPLSVNFFFNYSISDEVQTIPTLGNYITTVVTITLACSLVFQLPILVYFLAKGGLITPEFLRKYRKHAVVLALVLSAIITPPDVFSQFLVTIPIMLLYEVSIFIAAYISKREEKALKTT